MGLYSAAATAAGLRPVRQWPNGQPLQILLTGTFQSANWARAHLTPLGQTARRVRVWVVSSEPLPTMPGVQVVQPARWLASVVGAVPARLLTFAWLALRMRPHVIGGFHLLVNGLVASLLARSTGARSLYFCVGGPMELIDGGIWAENRIFSRLHTRDAVVESRLLNAVARMDLVVTMGSKAGDYLRARRVNSKIVVVPGSIDPRRFFCDQAVREFDLVLVGRLVPVKRIDRFIEAVREVANRRSGVSAVIVGDGPLRRQLEDLAVERGLSSCLQFVGSLDDVGSWLRRSRLFMLTSETEGLALSLMEAMSCGAVPIVSDVGDLADLVVEGVNGHLVTDQQPKTFAALATQLLEDPARLDAFSQAAVTAAARFRPDLVTRQWDEVLASLDTRDLAAGSAVTNSVR